MLLLSHVLPEPRALLVQHVQKTLPRAVVVLFVRKKHELRLPPEPLECCVSGKTRQNGRVLMSPFNPMHVPYIDRCAS